MENNNQSSSSSPPSPPPPPPALRSSSPASSLTAQLFGDNDSPQSSTGIFASIFPPPSTMTGNSSCLLCSKSTMHYEPFDSKVWSTVHGTSAGENAANKNTASTNIDVLNMERRSIFQERIEPCPLSSSIYYGGQEDMYIRSSCDLTSNSYTKDSEEDPNHMQSATRGNWWQGSLYY